MKKTKFQRVTAFMLALVLLLCGGALSVSADSSTNVTTSDIKELLNTISYNDYTISNAEVPSAKTYITVNGRDGVYYNSMGKEISVAGDYSADYANDGEKSALLNSPLNFEADGIEGLYIPSTGEVVWEIKGVPTARKYSVYID